MSQEISIILSLTTAQASAKLNEFLGHAVHGFKELAAEVIGAYASFEGLKKLFEVTSEVIQLEEAIGKLAERTGLSVPLLAALKDEAAIMKVPFEELSTSLGKFSQLIFDAATIGGKPADAFERLKITLLDADGALKSTDVLLSEVAQKFKEMPAGPQKAETAVALFGRAGRDLIPVLNEGADGIERLKAAGSPITDESVAQATEFEKALREVHVRIEEVFLAVANNLLPELIKIADQLKEFTSDANNSSLAVTSLTGFFKGLVTIAIVAVAAFRDLGLWIGGGLAVAIENVKDEIDIVITAFNLWIDTIRKVVVALVALAQDAVQAFGVIFRASQGHLVDAVGEMKALAEDSSEQIKTIFKAVPDNFAANWDQASKKFADIMTRTKEFAQNSLLEVGLRWMGVGQMIDDLWAKTEKKSAGEAKAGPADTSTKFFPGPSIQTLKSANEYAKIANDIFKQSEKLINNNPFTSQLEKAQALLPLLREQKAIVESEIAKANSNLNSATTEDQKIAAKKEQVRLQGELNDLTEKEMKLNALSSFSDQFKMVQVELANSWGNWAQQTASAFKTTFMSAVSTISNGITGLIMGTKTWAQALKDIGTGIMTQVIQSIVQMGVQYVMTHVLMRGAMALTHAIGVALGWSAAAQTTAQEASKAPALATNAATASVGSYGTAAIVGAALAIAAIGAIIAFASARETGGPVMAGMPYIVGERRPELFIPTQSGTILPSVPQLTASPRSSGSAEQVSGSSSIQMHIVDSVEAAHKRARKDPDMEHWVVDVVNRNVHRIRGKA